MDNYFCEIHNSKFYRNQKGDRTWYSHKIQGEDGYCNMPKDQESGMVIGGRAETPSTANPTSPASFKNSMESTKDMLKCNAMNNAIAFIGSKQGMTLQDLDEVYSTILDRLVNS